MAEKNVTKNEAVAEDSALKTAFEKLNNDYEVLKRNYNKVVTAYNKAISIIAENYAGQVSKQILDSVDEAAKN